jgi:hypothetical protein
MISKINFCPFLLFLLAQFLGVYPLSQALGPAARRRRGCWRREIFKVPPLLVFVLAI